MYSGECRGGYEEPGQNAGAGEPILGMTTGRGVSSMKDERMPIKADPMLRRGAPAPMRLVQRLGFHRHDRLSDSRPVKLSTG